VKEGYSSKEAFRQYDNGTFKYLIPTSRQPNVLKAVLIGKKAWGLLVNEWTDGIVECTFTREELLNEFVINNITIPDSLLRDFDNTIHRKKIKRNENYLKVLRESRK
jgi:hypothetical protein